MKDKIVQFPAPTTGGVARITAYRPTTRAETLIAVWLCGWAMLTATECVRQINQASLASAQVSQPAKAPTYVTLTRPITSDSSSGSVCHGETCNFSHNTGVLGLN